MVLATATEHDLECWQLDFNAAFLAADVEVEVDIKMEKFDENGTPMVTIFLKSLYSLRQNPSH